MMYLKYNVMKILQNTKFKQTYTHIFGVFLRARVNTTFSNSSAATYNLNLAGFQIIFQCNRGNRTMRLHMQETDLLILTPLSQTKKIVE